ncbi:hypothetical protein ABZ307_07460 [Streptomyces griseorubiginosus]|uniref:hypothetical protein n=1 Tax=Streptomyces griseorubiginosus TaxID=67304 RepID=UPI0033A2C540
MAVAAPTLTLVIDHVGWRWAFGAVGLAGLVWAGYWARRGAEGPYAPGAPEGTGADTVVVPYRRILLSGTWLSAALGAFAACLVPVGHGLLTRRRSRPPLGAGAGALMCLAGGAVALFAVTDAVWLKVLLMLGPMAPTSS